MRLAEERSTAWRPRGARASFCLALTISGFVGVTVAQEHPDRGSGTANHNFFYYVDHPDPQVRSLLTLTETAHLDNEGGPLTDIEQGRYDDAWGDLEYVLRNVVNHPRALQALCLLAKLTHRYSAPLPAFERALRLYPEYAVTRYQYGRYLLDIGDLDAGIANLETALTLDPAFMPGWVALAEAHGRKNEPDEARQAAERARRLGYQGTIAGIDGPAERQP